MMTRLHQCIVVMTLIIGRAMAQTDTTFTYQGSLTEAGEPADGSYNLDFSLWDALSGGNQVGSTIEFNGLAVTDGLFTVELDYGAGVFDGTQLWLEISVDGTELAPRQPLTSAPHSIQTRGIFVDAENNVGVGTKTPLWELEVANLTEGDGAECGVTANDAAGAIAAYSSTLPPPWEHYAGRVSLFADFFTQGLDLRANSAEGDIRFHSGGFTTAEERMRITSTGKVGIGTTEPQAQLGVGAPGNYKTAIWGQTDSGDGRGVMGYATGLGGTGVYGAASNTGSITNYGGYFWADGSEGRGVQGWATGSSGRGVYGYAESQTGINYGVYGVTESPTGYDFYAGGYGADYGSSSSIRWKRNIEPINDPLGKTAQLRGVYFDWDREHGGRHDVGMIAEEVGAVLPEIVIYEANGIDANGMDYSKLTPLLVEAINALRAEKDAEIADLQDELDAVRQRSAELDERVAKLEAAIAQLIAGKGAEQ